MRKQPSYKLVVADARKPRDGKAVDILGTYSPQRKDKPLTVDIEKVDKWLALGAQPTDRAKKIMDIARKAAEEQGVTKVTVTATPRAPKMSRKKKDAIKKAEDAAAADKIEAQKQSEAKEDTEDDKSSDETPSE